MTPISRPPQFYPLPVAWIVLISVLTVLNRTDRVIISDEIM
ncbi:hypothetical protein C900_00308 [Fulvivirga imtechensis AK7]|uniref:Uncharacterized protein n=1 Tax=Fulvivirga imtechensis AK7 TaxID=1237149 RepID=L8JLS1_9BACT|nr:hypothetical protein C900_00308 [Fulvivirga imtechensis AK7]